MESVFTITPNPALDTCGVTERLVPDEKNYVHDVVHFPGGNGINVARVLSRLKIPCIASGFLGGAIGEEFRMALDRERVRGDFVTVRGMTRMSVTVTQSKTHCQTRLSFPGPKISRFEAAALDERAQRLSARTILMCGGSLPEGYSALNVSSLIKRARKRGLSVVIDCPGWILKELLESGPSLIKPNLVEFQELVGMRLRSIDEICSQAMSLTRKIRMVCVSSVNGGALLVTRKGTWYGKGKRIMACSTVGAGDSMVAGILSRFIHESVGDQEWDALAPESLRWGIAAGMATASSQTGYLGQASDIRHFVSQVRIKRIQ